MKPVKPLGGDELATEDDLVSHHPNQPTIQLPNPRPKKKKEKKRAKTHNIGPNLRHLLRQFGKQLFRSLRASSDVSFEVVVLLALHRFAGDVSFHVVMFGIHEADVDEQFCRCEFGGVEGCERRGKLVLFGAREGRRMGDCVEGHFF